MGFIKDLQSRFIEIYGDNSNSASLFFAPGRVNLIGEHTDYNAGYVLPCALSFGTYLLIRKNGEKKLRFATTNFDAKAELDINQEYIKEKGAWINYPYGVINEFKKLGFNPEGYDMLFSGTIPNEAGLSSSASIEVVMATALNDLYNAGLTKVEIAKLCQRAENQFVGVNCGIMDMFAVAVGKKDHALFINCGTFEYEHVPLQLSGYKIIISNTNVKRGLADSKYNERRSECEQSVVDMKQGKDIDNLSQVALDEFNGLSGFIDNPIIRKRAHHVISENARVLKAVEALKSGDLAGFGLLMNQSHDSLKEDYAVTGIELDTLVEEARKISGVIGSRMTGAGFGGCTVSIVKEESQDDFIREVGKNYKNKTGLQADFYIADIGDGSKRINI